MLNEETVMSKAVVTSDRDAIVSEIDIAAPPERVFKSLTDEEETRRRSPGLGLFEMDARVGGRWRLEMRPPQAFRGVSVIRHEGEILEFEPPRLLVYTWLANFHDDPKHTSIVRWELTPTATGTHVKLTHSGLSTEPDAKTAYTGGWPGVLEALAKAVEQV
jgi:uncharacterized protein YndB with AHSA1/START domain